MMLPSEIRQVLTQNIDTVVDVTTEGQEKLSILVQDVDQEGCSCLIVGSGDYDPKTGYWLALDEIKDVSPHIKGALGQ